MGRAVGEAHGGAYDGRHGVDDDLEAGGFDSAPSAEAAYRVGTHRDFACGFMMGSVLGLIMIIWLFERSLTVCRPGCGSLARLDPPPHPTAADAPRGDCGRYLL